MKKWREQDVIKVITGVRRCGKSTLFGLYIEYLKSSGVEESQIVWINLEEKENARLLDENALYAFLSARLLKDKTTYYFIDEIQMCKNFEAAIDSLYVKKTADIHITGSNAFMLSGELATLISGRYIEIKMLPFSFAEYCAYRDAYTNKEERIFNDYLNFGSFPMIAHMDADIEQVDKYLEGIYNTILIKDVANRKHINDISLLENIIRFLSSNVGSSVAAANITKTLNESGRRITQKTVEKYMKALTDCYLFYKVDRYNVKGKTLLKTLGKYYIVDTGLRNYLLSSQNLDIGHQIENIVFLELLRRGFRVNIGKVDEKEIDFVATKTNVKEYYQVSQSVLDAQVLERELAPLRKTKDDYPKYLLTLDTITGNYEGIKQLNLIDWLLKR
jgi:predicted AAA+ superfamily ATPase